LHTRPDWLSWTHSAKHLPETFHASTDAFEYFLDWIAAFPYRSSTFKPCAQGVIILMCLGVGLVARDIHTIKFGFVKGGQYYGNVDESVQHLQNSALKWTDLQTLLDACSRACEDISLLFENPREAQAAPGKFWNPTTTPPTTSKMTTRSAAPASKKYVVVSYLFVAGFLISWL